MMTWILMHKPRVVAAVRNLRMLLKVKTFGGLLTLRSGGGSIPEHR
jgi:hypothetical protein